MDYGGCEYLVPCGKDKYISKNELLLHLKTYNIYYEGQNLQLRHREEEGELIVEGLLNISWGLRRPIRLQMQDDNQRIRPPPSSSSWHSGCNLGAHGSVLKPSTLPDIQVTDAEAVPNAEAPGSGAAAKSQPEETPQLMRTRSDVGVRRRGSARTPSEQRRIRRHRFSINGHFYNHKTSVFTPAYGSVTNVRINSTMTTPQVLKLLLNKFKIENSAEEFALYIVHTSGGPLRAGLQGLPHGEGPGGRSHLRRCSVHQIRDARPQELHPEAGGRGGSRSEEANAQILHPPADDRAKAGGDFRRSDGDVKSFAGAPAPGCVARRAVCLQDVLYRSQTPVVPGALPVSARIAPALSQPILPRLQLRSVLGGFRLCKWGFSQQGSGRWQLRPKTSNSWK
ncbi:ras association domain-containing protein 2 isoform X1 [Mycteria americana]|uniref:ras association domain-containing protein 2 isoform X1 n=1 Tax=Mycteria americana TaxID=33587 RepID=UPI003F58EF9B